MNEEQQRLWSLLQDALPNVATQMRGSLSNLYTAVGRLLPPEELEQQPELTQSAAILNQSYYRLLRMVNNLSALAILKEHTPFPTANVELVGWLDELVLQAQPLAEMKGVDLRFSTPLRHHIAAVHHLVRGLVHGHKRTAIVVGHPCRHHKYTCQHTIACPYFCFYSEFLHTVKNVSSTPYDDWVIIHIAKITILAQVCKLCINRKRNTLNKGHKNKKNAAYTFR